MIGRLSHMSRKAVAERATELLDSFRLHDAANRPLKTYSGGMRRRLDLAAALMANPPVLFLDEPTTGLDPSGRQDLWEVIEELTAEGTTVLLTTHYMDEAEALADRVAVINSGRIIAEGTPESLGGRDVGESSIRFRLPDGGSLSIPPVPAQVSANGVYEIKTDKEIEVLATLTNWALHEKVEIVGLTVDRLTLEDVYLRLTGYKPDSDDASSFSAGSR